MGGASTDGCIRKFHSQGVLVQGSCDRWPCAWGFDDALSPFHRHHVTRGPRRVHASVCSLQGHGISARQGSPDGPLGAWAPKTYVFVDAYHIASIFDTPLHGSHESMDATPDASLMDIDPDVGPTFTAMPVEQSHAALPGQVIPVSSNPMVPFTASSPPSRDAAVGTPPTGTPAPASSAPPQTSGSASDAPKEGWSIVKSSADLVAAASLPTKAVAPYRHAASAAVASQARSLLERPETFLTYVQVLFNASIILVFIYLLFSVVWTIQHDVSLKVKEYELGMSKVSLTPRLSR